MAILELHNVTLDLGGKRILNSLTAEFWEGRIHALIGPNGAGKSTLASTIMGLPGYTEFGGDIVFDGRSLRGVPVHERARRGITMAWQEPARFEGLRMDRFMAVGARVKTCDKVSEELSRVGLDPARYLARKVDKTLSGGERKRVEVYNTPTASAPYARGHVDCKEIVQGQAVARAVPVVEVNHPQAHITHEAAIGSVDSKQLQTLMSRGLDEEQATDLIVEGLLS